MLALPGAEVMPAPLLDRAGRIARGLQAQVEIFLSLYEPEILQLLERRELLEERISVRIAGQRRELERSADRLRDQGLSVRVSVRWDYPMFEGVIRQVLRHRPDLLMFPAIRTAEVTPRTLAYREARLIEACPCPLLLLKTPEVYSKGAIVAAVDPLHARETPRDLDEAIVGAAKTLSYALADPPVRIYHAVMPLRPAVGEIPGAPSLAAQETARRAAAEARIVEMASRHDIPPDCVHVESGRVEASLPIFARESRAQVVVMGAVSRSFPERALFGHTAEKVLDALACDVLVVKPERFRCPVAADPAPAVPRPT
ncbi:MAG TPA: universal stress protein [Steroidobacteraceae bacterium]|nr:universal stress protein [Steroidobacteraceae bacterium]